MGDAAAFVAELDNDEVERRIEPQRRIGVPRRGRLVGPASAASGGMAGFSPETPTAACGSTTGRTAQSPDMSYLAFSTLLAQSPVSKCEESVKTRLTAARRERRRG